MKNNYCNYSGRGSLLILLVSILVSMLVIISGHLYASERDQEKEAQYYKQLEQKSPQAAEYFREATEALDRGESKIAADKYKQVLDLVEDFAPAYRRLSYVTEQDKQALRYARRALKINNHPYNKMAVVTALLRFTDKTYHGEALPLAQEVAKELPDDPQAYILLCQTALANYKDVLFNAAVLKLKTLDPDGMATHYFMGISAAMAEDWERAEKEILRTKELGLPAAIADKILEESGIKDRAQKWRIFRYSIYGIVVWAVVLVLLLLTGMVLSKLTLVSVEKQDPHVTGEPSAGIRLMRRIYKVILGMSSIYFYISLPVVIILVLAAGGGVIYGFYTVGRIPIKLVLIIVVLMFVTIGAMIKSLFIRPKEEDPGPRLEEKEAPKLFQVLREVAQKVGTQMVDTVFIVSGAEIAVFERGSLWKRFLGKTERCLILGLGVLKGLTQLQLKSILAHEFGHLYNKDTAGGTLALHVRRSIHASAQAMAEGGAARWYNPAWLFINGFYRIFLRISEGASRLQEVLADQLSALAYGAKAFVQGLSSVIKRSIEFNLMANIEITQAEKEKRELHNLYTLEVPKNWPEGFFSQEEGSSQEEKSPPELIEAEFKEALEQPTSAYDSHPAPQKRIEWVKRLKTPEKETNNEKTAWELLENPESLEKRMTKELYENVKQWRVMQAMAEAVYEEE
ncbi:MAG: M48 family metalloprotease [Candidatus Aminicenantes bacterium]|nr:M48 family metalloprotease [Candidatus Aminicenantes bacterium]NIM83395.1 M48 family metalloprotease [Candidatus Aminicenantes bacterium]NIN22787.1 M48 family metalloprotease [Candidatus Aminicenantes bacterium]NIN46521.1 M48 family metalloprotease [Candidatus Aminicenantes bacterium]NIN89426.1 M48 family metalloprotease [Candidatus Aminicenantes bacterium]